jgi:hypothetical protein
MSRWLLGVLKAHIVEVTLEDLILSVWALIIAYRRVAEFFVIANVSYGTAPFQFKSLNIFSVMIIKWEVGVRERESAVRKYTYMALSKQLSAFPAASWYSCMRML